MIYAIELINLSKKFAQIKGFSHAFLHPFQKPKFTSAVNSINLQIKNGELFGLVGPNGAGKTTLIKLLCCLLLPTSGTARVAGYDILKDEKKIKACIGLVSGEERNFYWRLTGRQNLAFFAALYNLSTQEVKRKIDTLNSLLKIDKELDNRFSGYSTGVKQRLAIARSLLHNPKILFMDEPTKSLDPTIAKDLRAFIKDKLVGEQKKTVIFTTHNLYEAADLTGRLAIMDKGRIKACGTIDDLRETIGNPNATIEEIFAKVTGG